jgi:hypothetical protein
MFQICVPNQKVKGKVAICYIPKTFFKCNDWEHQNTQYY